MIARDDLRAAVAAGHLSEAQAGTLVAFAAARNNARAGAGSVDEPFELFRGFNEIFVVVGLAILGTGWLGVWALVAGTSNGFGTVWMTAMVATAAVVAGLSEYFVRRRRMVAPAIALVLAWAASALWFWIVTLGAFSVFGGVDPGRAALALGLATATVAAYWWRYRVPFAMALMAVGTFGAMVAGLAALSGVDASPGELFVLSGTGPFAWGTLVLGLGLFALAMRFDMSDPHRMTLRAANGFWLHVAAAPAIVNTLALTLLAQGGAALGLLALLLGAIAVVAVAIDRRSFLISAVGYVVAIIARTADGAGGGAVGVLALGAGLVALGAGWQAARAPIVARLPAWLRDRLPPSA